MSINVLSFPFIGAVYVGLNYLKLVKQGENLIWCARIHIPNDSVCLSLKTIFVPTISVDLDLF